MAIDARQEVEKWVRSINQEMLFEQLRTKVWGQDQELRKAATLIYAFFRSLVYEEGRKYHFLIEGSSGCGKSTFAHALKACVPFPVIIADASMCTPSGYRGTQASAIVNDDDLLQEWCGCGIIILDELDKLMTDYDAGFHRGAQENFLKMLDGDDVILKDESRVNCGRMLFIGMGAFSEQRKKQSAPSRCIGFDSSSHASIAQTQKPIITREDLLQAGVSEQLLGRFVTVLHFKSLGRKVLNRAVREACMEVESICGILPLSRKEVHEIVCEAMQSDFGCRSIRSAVWEKSLDRLFSA